MMSNINSTVQSAIELTAPSSLPILGISRNYTSYARELGSGSSGSQFNQEGFR